MTEKVLTMDDDWGTKGAQATGAQVQQFIKSQLRDLHAKDTELEKHIHAATEGCYIVYVERHKNEVHAVPWWKWKELEEVRERTLPQDGYTIPDGEIDPYEIGQIIGILVIESGHSPIIIGKPSRSDFKWLKNPIAVNTTVGDDVSKACADFAGKEHTAEIIAKASQLYGSDESKWSQYLTGWCHSYERSFIIDSGLKIGIAAGNWWHPSLGELLLIAKHKAAIEQCVSVIRSVDFDLILDGGMTSSTEISAQYVWGFDYHMDDVTLLIFQASKTLSESCFAISAPSYIEVIDGI